MAWNPILCAKSDLELRVGDLTLWTQDSDAPSDQIIADTISQAGALITSKLNRYLPEIYKTTIGVYSNLPFADWLVMRGYSYDDLDNVLNEITNPQVLNPWAVAFTLTLLCERMVAKFQVIGQQTVAVMVDQRDYWKKESDKLEKECVAQLKIDLNQDGNIRDFSRPRTHVVWLRG